MDDSFRCVTWGVEDALDELDRLSGWRAMFLFPPEAADADAIVEALPWVKDAAPRKGTVVRLLKVRHGLLLVTGGVLSDEEGALLFDIRERLADIVKRALVVPPRTAARSLVKRMYHDDLLPIMPLDRLPNTSGWQVMSIVTLAIPAAISRSVRRIPTEMLDMESFRLTMLAGLVLALIFYLFMKYQGKRRDDMRPDPFRAASGRWSRIRPGLEDSVAEAGYLQRGIERERKHRW
jgi:hypothetical protein